MRFKEGSPGCGAGSARAINATGTNAWRAEIRDRQIITN